jgi:hypothetical protein
MMTHSSAAGASFAAAALLILLSNSALAAVSHLEVEYRTTPIGMDTPVPRFSWRHSTSPEVRGLEQTAYDITVKDAIGSLVWDSGSVADGHSVAIAYSGPALRPETRYSWSVSASRSSTTTLLGCSRCATRYSSWCGVTRLRRLAFGCCRNPLPQRARKPILSAANLTRSEF